MQNLHIFYNKLYHLDLNEYSNIKKLKLTSNYIYKYRYKNNLPNDGYTNILASELTKNLPIQQDDISSCIIDKLTNLEELFVEGNINVKLSKLNVNIKKIDSIVISNEFILDINKLQNLEYLDLEIDTDDLEISFLNNNKLKFLRVKGFTSKIRNLPKSLKTLIIEGGESKSQNTEIVLISEVEELYNLEELVLKDFSITPVNINNLRKLKKIILYDYDLGSLSLIKQKIIKRRRIYLISNSKYITKCIRCNKNCFYEINWRENIFGFIKGLIKSCC